MFGRVSSKMAPDMLTIYSHKRFDPAYNDARARAQKLGDFNFYSSCRSSLFLAVKQH